MKAVPSLHFVRRALLLGLGGLLLAAASASSAAAQEGICAEGETALVVITRARLMWLCQEGRIVTNYPISLGVRGAGKTARGDKRTPVGAYDLGKPRPSKSFGIFIPIAYPTPEQRRKGYTGKDVGIHGPPEDGLNGLEQFSNWTDGCIALNTRAHIEELAAWVTAKGVSRIRIVFP